MKFKPSYTSSIAEDIMAERLIRAQAVEFLAIMIVAVVNPVHDIWYYVATALALASEVIVVLGIIRDYNYSCTRPLPQFNAYKGGQEEIEIS